MFSKDDSLFTSIGSALGDARQRHINYLLELQQRHGRSSQILIIVYTKKGRSPKSDSPLPGLMLYATESLHRSLYLIDCIRLLFIILRDSWRPTIVTTQTPWEEGLLGLFLSLAINVPHFPQLHFDLLSDKWLREKSINRIYQIIALIVLMSATRIRVVSRPLQQKLKARLGSRAPDIDIVPVGVNFKPCTILPNDAKRLIADNIDGRPVILFVGRLATEKNLFLWLDVANDVLAVFPEARFVIAGSGELQSDIKRVIAKRAQLNQVLMLGAVRYSDLPCLYAAADIFLLTSHYEGFGRVILEASLAGIPSIATKCSGPEDIIIDNYTGILVDPNDKYALVQSCLNLLREPAKRRQMGQNAKKVVIDNLRSDKLVRLLIDHWSAA